MSLYGYKTMGLRPWCLRRPGERYGRFGSEEGKRLDELIRAKELELEALREQRKRVA